MWSCSRRCRPSWWRRDGAASVPGPAQAYGVEGVVSRAESVDVDATYAAVLRLSAITAERDALSAQVAAVRELRDRWADAKDSMTGNRSLVAWAFSEELSAALATDALGVDMTGNVRG